MREVKVPSQPNGGVYGDPSFYRAYTDLLDSLLQINTQPLKTTLIHFKNRRYEESCDKNRTGFD